MLPLTFVVTRTVAFMASDALKPAILWLAQLATRLVARRLDVPEIVVHGICLYVAAYVAEVERNASLVCPMRVSMTCDVIDCRTPRGHPRVHRPDETNIKLST